MGKLIGKNTEAKIIYPSRIMDDPNEPIEVGFDSIQIIKGKERYNFEGKLEYKWFPYTCLTLNGKIVNPMGEFDFMGGQDVEINGFLNKEFHISNVTFSPIITGFVEIRGAFFNDVVIGDVGIPVEKIVFSLPNFKELNGEERVTEIIVTDKGKTYASSNRLNFKTDNYIIKLDPRTNFSEYNKSLNNNGGFLIQYGGELSVINGSITHKEGMEVLDTFSTFLSFLNGKKSQVIFCSGIFEHKEKWCDYSKYYGDVFKQNISWTDYSKTESLKFLWDNFYQFCKDKDDREFLKNVIKWYLGTNKGSDNIEGDIIMAQSCLELIYNWVVVEKKQIIKGKDGANIQAANKIRLLISQMKINYNVPSGLKNLQKHIDENEGLDDAVGAIVDIRNAVVHSQLEKRKKLSEIGYAVKWEALQLTIWYIEMSLLFILDYKGEYVNRCDLTRNWGDTEVVPFV